MTQSALGHKKKHVYSCHIDRYVSIVSEEKRIDNCWVDNMYALNSEARYGRPH